MTKKSIVSNYREEDLKKVLRALKKELREYISTNYDSVEAFCWDANMNKSTISNFLNGKKDFQVSTLLKIAKAMNKELKIYVE